MTAPWLKIEPKTSDTFLDHLEIGGDRYTHDQKSRWSKGRGVWDLLISSHQDSDSDLIQ